MGILKKKSARGRDRDRVTDREGTGRGRWRGLKLSVQYLQVHTAVPVLSACSEQEVAVQKITMKR